MKTHDTNRPVIDAGMVACFTALFGAQDPPRHGPTALDEPPRFLTRDDCLALLRRAATFATDGGVTGLRLTSEWAAELRWARNRAQVATDRRDNRLTVLRAYEYNAGVELNQIDDEALAAAVRRAEALVPYQWAPVPELTPLPPDHPAYPETHIWSEATYDQPPAARGAIGRALSAPAEAAGLLSAGYLRVAARGTALLDTRQGGQSLYAPQTFAECSVTVHDSKTGGSGWAGASSYDWGAIDPETLAKRAVEKCLTSRDPVAVEPGRYVVVLEPQATHDLVRPLLGPISRWNAELPGESPYFLGSKLVQTSYGQRSVESSKLGLRLIDERITISHDPADPQLGVLPFSVMPSSLDGFVRAGISEWEPHRPVTWFDKGVLTNLAYDRDYAVGALHEERGLPYSGAFRMSGGDTTIEQMITGTRRGLLVTRFSTLQLLDLRSLLYTGLTRDGLWLIEDGKPTKPVKNFRFTDGPLFALDQVEQLGQPVPVFSPGQPAIVPPLKLREFNFTSLVDAV